MVTIQDVAKLAGVSVATVSRVLNNSSSVTEETRRKVETVMKKLNYQPNLLGRNLRRSETKMILVLLPNIANSFYSRIVKGIEDIAHKNGYNVMLCNTDSDKNREEVYLKLLRNRLADGVILMASALSKEDLSAIGTSYPVVQCCEYKKGLNIPHVSVNDRKAAYDAVKHLISYGHKRISMISTKTRFISTAEREAGYRQAMIEANLPIDENLIQYGNYSYHSGESAAKELLLKAQRPTAIFVISDIMAIGAIRQANEMGVKVPEEISIIGFDNIDFSVMCNPPLTTISQNQYHIGCVAMELLLKRMQQGLRGHEDIFIDHELILRDSTRIL